jgi:hypothetical protein
MAAQLKYRAAPAAALPLRIVQPMGKGAFPGAVSKGMNDDKPEPPSLLPDYMPSMNAFATCLRYGYGSRWRRAKQTSLLRQRLRRAKQTSNIKLQTKNTKLQTHPALPSRLK